MEWAADASENLIVCNQLINKVLQNVVPSSFRGLYLLSFFIFFTFLFLPGFFLFSSWHAVPFGEMFRLPAEPAKKTVGNRQLFLPFHIKKIAIFAS